MGTSFSFTETLIDFIKADYHLHLFICLLFKGIVTQKNNGQGDGGILSYWREGYVKGCSLRTGKYEEVLGL